MQSHELAAYVAEISALCETVENAIHEKSHCLALQSGVVAPTQARHPRFSAVVVKGLFDQMLSHCDSVNHRTGQHHAAGSGETALFLKLAVRQLKGSASNLNKALTERESAVNQGD